MSKKLNIPRLETLKTEALENIHSYDDPESPTALAQFTAKMKAILLQDPSMLADLPEYLPIALYGQIKFPPAAIKQWQQWLTTATLPSWDQFKTSVAFNNADLPLIKAVRDYSETVLIEACAVVFMISHDNSPASSTDSDQYGDDDRDNDDDRNNDYADDADKFADDDDNDEDGYDDQFDDIRFNGENS